MLRARQARTPRTGALAALCAAALALPALAQPPLAPPDLADAAEAAARAEALVRGRHFEGLPYDEAVRVTPAGAARLVEMLADPAEAEQHAAILEVLGICAAPGAYEAIEAFAAVEPSGEVDGAIWRARLAVPIALGHLARRDPRALQRLLRESRVAQPPAWRYRSLPSAGVGLTLHRRVIMGLALSGQPEARVALRDLPRRPALAGALSGSVTDVGPLLGEALALHGRVAAEGAEAVLGRGGAR